jgi:amino acid adenylation domain-containing protein/non-ribosomal peptide synthase protein (TIGR01720 family)
MTDNGEFTLPMLAGQREMWNSQQLDPANPMFAMGGWLDIAGPLDAGLFCQAMTQAVAETECLRARFEPGADGPVQFITAPGGTPIDQIDLRGEADPLGVARAWVMEKLATPMDLSVAPLHRFRLARVADEHFLMLVAVHHVLWDAFSQNLFASRLGQIYSAALGDEPSGPAIPPLSELVEDEQSYLTSTAFERDRLYWAERFAQAPELTSWSARPFTPGRSFLRVSGELSLAASDRLRAVAWDHRVTWPALAIAATALYTHRVTGQRDLLLTLPVTGRIGKNSQRVPGMRANFLPLSIHIDQSTTREQLLREVSADLSAALKRQRYRGDLIRRHLGVAGDDHRPFGPSINVLAYGERFALGPCTAAMHDFSSGPVNDLQITAYEGADRRIGFLFTANPELYTAEELAGHQSRFETLLTGLAAGSAGAALSQLDLLTPMEYKQVVVEWNWTGRPAVYVGLAERVRELASRQPEAVAVRDGGEPVTYAELAGRASAASRRLAEHGAGPGHLIGLLGDPGARFIAGALGVLGTGAAFVPLDVNAPVARTAALVAENEVRLLLVGPECHDLAGQVVAAMSEPVTVLVADDRADSMAELLPTAGLADDLAYVIFTSGSTGKPKGAMVHRGGMINHLLAKVDDLSLTAADSVVQNAPLTFDIAIWQMFVALMTGGYTRVVSRTVAADPEQLFGIVAREQITILEVVPSLLRAALDSWEDNAGPGPLPDLRWMVVTGEALPPDLCLRWTGRYPGIPVVNAYGPTECSDDVTHAFISGPQDLPEGRVAIGRALRNTSLYVLDDGLRPVPPGGTGELYVGGAGVGRGYAGDRSKTSLAFLADPFANWPGARMYRTGDRVRSRLDGQLEFLERRDHQVKIRGHRIELGEVESGLRGLPGVIDAAADASTDAQGRKRLVGYIVGTEDAAALRVAAAGVLPSYMVPSVFVFLPALPLTANGKLDRKALPAPTAQAVQGREAATPAEATLRDLFAQVLSVPEVGVEDSFFDLGGDSIGSIQLVSQARRAGLVITPQDIFRAKSAAALAVLARPADEVAAVGGDDGTGIVPPTAVMRWWMASGAPIEQFYQSMVLRVPAGMSLNGLTAAVAALLERHPMLRARLTGADGDWFLEVASQSTVRAADLVTRIDLAGASETELAARAADQASAAQSRLRPREGVMLQAVWLDRGDTEPGRLVLAVQHTVVDGVSWRIIAEDLAEAYTSAGNGQSAPAGTSFRSWSELLSTEAAERDGELELWRTVVSSPDPLLGARRLDQAQDVRATAGTIRVDLPAGLTGSLLTSACAAFHGSLNDLLLTALALAVADWRDEPGNPAGLLVGLEGHGREQFRDGVDLSRTVGWFTTVYPAYLDTGVTLADVIASGSAAASAVKRVKEQLRAFPDHGLGFGLLRFLSDNGTPELAGHPMPQVGFNYLGRFTTTREQDWAVAEGSGAVGEDGDPLMPLPYVLNVTAVTEDGPDGPRLSASWMWAGNVLGVEQANQISRRWVTALTELNRHLSTTSLAGHTPSDFGLVTLSQDEVDQLEARYPALREVLPLAPLQEGMLFHTSYDERALDVYHVQLVIDLQGKVDKARLRAASAALLSRHPQVGAAFAYTGSGQPVQIIDGDVSAAWHEHDLSSWDRDDLSSEMDRLTAEDRLRRFDLARPPLMRTTLISLGEDRYRFLMTNHHIVSDGWSMPIALREFTALYEHGGDGRLPTAPAYHHYLTWLAAQDRDSARLAWREALAGLETATLLGQGSEAGTGVLPQQVNAELSGELSAAVTSWARRHGFTVNTVFQGAWALMLSGLTGQTDIVFGSTVAGRSPEVPGIDSMIGMFINTVPVRHRFLPGDTFTSMLTRLQDGQAALMPHQHLALADIQQSAGLGPLFDTVVVFENHPVDVNSVGSLGDLTVTGLQTRDTTHYPVSLLVMPGSQMRFRLDYLPHLFAAGQIERLAWRMVRVLEQMITDEAAPLARLSVADEADLAQVLDFGSGPVREVPPGTFPDLFAAQVTRTPSAVALAFGTETVSYADLDARANRFARVLIGAGVGPGDIVAIMLPRSIDTIVSLIGVLKAGAAYLPVDPNYPADRIRYLLDDARPVLLLSTTSQPPVPGIWALMIDDATITVALAQEDGGQITDAERGRPLRERDVAYVIYTSGSTGRPKGVVVEHMSISRLITDQLERFGVGGQTRLLQFASLSFDAAAWEISTSLLCGGTLVLSTDDDRQPGEPLARLIHRHGINLVSLPPSVIGVFPPEITLPSDLVFITAGEACPPELVQRWAGERDMINAYGPTEATVCVTMSDPLAAGARPPIGRPLANTRLYVLDQNLRPVPAGAAGELYIAGDQVARGYLNRRGLTAERFVADLFSPTPGGRMYRTGDLVRWNRDGQLDYLGRSDDQVKIRGFRIELGEVEAAVRVAAGVAQAAVIVREDIPGDKRLVAYLVPEAATPELETVRATVAAALPGHMVPSAFVALAALPLTTNGKVDRAALPVPSYGGSSFQRAASTPEEALLCKLFGEVLGADSVGVLDNFFALGGHSLLATRLVSRIRASLGVELPVRALFEAPTAEALAKRLPTAHTARPALVAAGRPERLPLSFAQLRLWFLNRLEGPSPAYNIPTAVRISGPLDRLALEGALAEVCARHESLRTVFPDDDGSPWQLILAPELSRPVLGLTETDAGGLNAALLDAAAQGFDIAADLPLRATLFRLSPDEHVLLLVQHHVAGDGWSLVPFFRDLAASYTALLSGEPERPAPLPVQYADYALWQRDLLGEESNPDSLSARQLTFWRQALDGLPPQIDLPTDRPRPAVASYAGDLAALSFDAELYTRITGLAQETGASVFMVLQAGLAALLTKLGAGTDIPIGTPLAGRTDEALDDLVGFFVNTLVMRCDTSADPTFRELVGRMRETGLAAYAHQEVPFERVVEAVNPVRSMARQPLFQVMLTYNNTAAIGVSLPGLETSLLPVPTGTAKFDLSFELAESLSGNGIDGYLEYSTDLFDRATAERLSAQLVQLIGQAVTEPDLPLHQLSPLSAADREQVLVTWNDTARAVSKLDDLAGLIAEQASLTPHAIALECGGQRITFAELDEQANRLARLLLDRGAEADKVIAVALPRSAELVIATLAVIKAGAAYLPIDLDYPPSRIEYMVRDASPVLVLSTAGIRDSRTEFTGVPVLALDTGEVQDALRAQESTAVRPVSTRSAEHLAYVIYTSGSTGRPKGVMVTVGALVNLLQDMSRRIELGPGDRWFAVTTFGFDISNLEIFAPLMTGATLVFGDAVEARDPALLVQRVATDGITVMQATPTMWQALLTEDDRVFGGVKVLTGGEALSADLAVTLRGAARSVLNVYGPTETTIWSTAGLVPGDGGNPDIGVPLDNTAVYVLDDTMQPVPAGVPGHLYLAGLGLARGYLNRRDLTVERFVADPFGQPGSRMYRTGDLAAWTGDGRLRFLGRADRQVKLRGFRIELPEIESVLRQHPTVGEAVVIVREDRASHRQLVAYAVPTPDQSIDPAALRAHVAASLPEYMVPAIVMPLAALPLTSNRKVDQKALPAPVQERAPVRESPSTAAERDLQLIFADVLGVQEVGLRESFFDLGGDSIMSIQLVSRARKQGLALSPRDVFTHQTVSALAAALEQLDAQERAAAGEDEGTGPVLLTPIVAALRDNGGEIAGLNQSVVLTVPAGTEIRVLTEALQTVIDHHDALRMRLLGDWSMEVGPRGSVGAAELLTTVDAGGLDETALAGLLAEEETAARQRLTPAAGVVLQAVFADRGIAEAGRLLLMIHHLAVDGVSWHILAEDLLTAAEAARAGRPAHLAPVGTSLRSFASALHASAMDPARAAEVPMWTQTLGQPDPLLGSRPLDPAIDLAATAGRLDLIVPADLTARLLNAVPAAFRCGVGDALLAALTLAVAHEREAAAREEAASFSETWSLADNAGPVPGLRNPDGQVWARSGVLVMVEGHGREQITAGTDLSRTVGWFTTAFPVFADPGQPADVDRWADGPFVGHAVRQVKETLSRLPEHGLGYGLLRHLNPQTAEALATAGNTPQLGFNFLGRLGMTAADTGDWAIDTSDRALRSGADPAMALPQVLSLDTVILPRAGGQVLAASWTWAGQILTEEWVTRLAGSWQHCLEAIAAYAESPGASVVTPSDLTLSSLSQAEIDEFEQDMADWGDLA